MNIVFVASEAAPFAKTGGLADVCGALPVELQRQGHNVAVIIPYYRQVKNGGHEIEPLHVKFDVPIGSKIVRGRLLRSRLPGSDVPVYFVENDDYFDRPDLYRTKGEDYKDNCERFVFFSRAALEAIRILQLEVDVVHCHDWQTGLAPAFLHVEYAHAPGYETVGSLLTIHNLAYQGIFWHWDMLLTGLDWKYFNWQQMEFYGKLNLLKTGIVFADALTTVSPTYATEIQSDPLGCGLEGVLKQRVDALSGIVNGVHYGEWDPVADPHLAKNYSANNWREGKAACKAALQRELGLPVSPRTPLIGLISRLDPQKGWDLIAEVMRRWTVDRDVQWAILGSGEPVYHELLQSLAQQFPGKVAARLEFNAALAHRIEAGSDLFLMPSRYEPCGLNQLYSMRYGAVPVVRSTGGLADTVRHASPENLASGEATGFCFHDYDAGELEWAVGEAIGCYLKQPDTWATIVETGMRQDWSWTRSAAEYAQLYARIKQQKIEERKRLLASRA